tara:strand:+ start:342 stop:2165 length:1824 start_codon:yes stop_codon:yes gene_type:complete
MARTRFPTLQQRISLVSVRGPSGVGSQEAVRTMNVLASNLDRMSNFFFKKASAIAEIEGAEFGAKNPITEQELKNQSLTVEDIENRLGDNNTVFGRASRKASLAILETELELSASRQFTDIISNAIENDQDVDSLADDLDAVTLQYSKLASQASPIVGKRLTASLNTTASSKYHSYTIKKANETLSKLKNTSEALVFEIQKNYSSKLEKIINETDSDKLATQIDQFKNIQKGALSYELNKFKRDAPTIIKFSNDFDSDHQQTLKDYVINVAKSNNSEYRILKALDSNNFKGINPKIKILLDKLTTTEKASLRDTINQNYKNREDLEETKENNLVKQNEEKTKTLVKDATISIDNGDENKARDLIKQLRILNETDKANELEVQLNKTDGIRTFDDQSDLEEINNKIANLSASFDTLDQYKNSFTPKTRASLQQKIEQIEKDEVKEIIGQIAGKLGFNINDEIPSGDPRFKYSQIVSRISSKLDIARKNAQREGKFFNARDFVDSIQNAEIELINIETFKKDKESFEYYFGIITADNQRDNPLLNVSINAGSRTKQDYETLLRFIENLNNMNKKERPKPFNTDPVDNYTGTITELKKLIENPLINRNDL